MFRYTAPPRGEVRFRFTSETPYVRDLYQCDVCGHFRSVHAMDTRALYTGDYVTSNYGDAGMLASYERILALDPSRSDNVGRVSAVTAFAGRHHFGEARARSVLDVGSGLCVFLYRMKSMGWACTAVDPDPRAVEHARNTVGVAAVCGDFMTLPAVGRFDLVTLNKVLEHVADPVVMLQRTHLHLETHGLVYIEVPDGEAAIADGPEREEFFIDHLHAFSAASVALLTRRAGFLLAGLERLREPSGKYTLRAYLALPGTGQAGDDD